MAKSSEKRNEKISHTMERHRVEGWKNCV